MNNKQLQEILKQYPDDLPIMIEMSGEDFPEEHDTLHFEVVHLNQEYRKECQYLSIKGFVE